MARPFAVFAVSPNNYQIHPGLVFFVCCVSMYSYVDVLVNMQMIYGLRRCVMQVFCWIPLIVTCRADQ
jgi:hypothetical protein